MSSINMQLVGVGIALVTILWDLGKIIELLKEISRKLDK